MTGFLIIPTANADDVLTGAVLDTTATTPQTITGLTNGTEYEAYAISSASTAFTPSAAVGITVVASSTGEIVAASGENVIAIPGTPLEDDIVVFSRTGDNASVTFPVPTETYTVAFDGSGNVPSNIQYKRMGGTPDANITVQADPTATTDYSHAYIIYVLRGVDTTTALDATPTEATENSSDTITPAAITTVTNGAMIMLHSGHDDDIGATVSTWPDGFTDNQLTVSTSGADAVMCVAASATQIQATFGTFTPTLMTWSQSDSIGAITCAWRPA